MNEINKKPIFPLIRHLSKLITPVLVNFPISANQITATSLLTGLAASLCVMMGDVLWDIAAGLLFIITYTLDNCDGEIARIKNQCSAFGMRFDSFVDWVVHSSLFASMGYGAAERFGNELWLWLGIVAAVGGTINYVLGFYMDSLHKARAESEEAWEAMKTGEFSRKPEGICDWMLFVFRELMRADFCFIFLALAFADSVWLLVPFGAIGSQIYWISQFVRGASDFHV